MVIIGACECFTLEQACVYARQELPSSVVENHYRWTSHGFYLPKMCVRISSQQSCEDSKSMWDFHSLHMNFIFVKKV